MTRSSHRLRTHFPQATPKVTRAIPVTGPGVGASIDRSDILANDPLTMGKRPRKASAMSTPSRRASHLSTKRTTQKLGPGGGRKHKLSRDKDGNVIYGGLEPANCEPVVKSSAEERMAVRLEAEEIVKKVAAMTEEWTDKGEDDGMEMDSYSHMLQRIGGAIGSLAEGVNDEANEKMDVMFAIR